MLRAVSGEGGGLSRAARAFRRGARPPVRVGWVPDPFLVGGREISAKEPRIFAAAGRARVATKRLFCTAPLLARRGAVPVATARAARRNAVRVGRDIGGYCSDTQSGNAQPLRVTASCGLLRRGSGRRCGRPPKRALQMVTYRRRCMHYMLTRRGGASTTARDRVNFTLGRNASINTRLLPY